MLKGIIISVSLSLLWFIFQLPIYHVINPQKRIRFLTLLYLPTLPLYIFFYFNIHSFPFLTDEMQKNPFYLGLINGLVLHLIFYFTYLACYHYIDRPVTLRILVELLTHPKGNIFELEKQYSVKAMIQKRLDAMERGKVIQKKEDHYFLSKKGEWIARFVFLGRRLLDKHVLKY